MNEALTPCVPHLPPTYAQGLLWMLIFGVWGYLWGSMIEVLVSDFPDDIRRRVQAAIGALVMLGILGAMLPRAAETFLIYGEPLREINWPYLWGLVYAAGMGASIARPLMPTLRNTVRSFFRVIMARVKGPSAP